jgi:DNA-binding NarL/FixJ family response regulator
MRKIRVLIAEDHALVRSGFRALLEELRDIEVIGEVANGLEALQFVASRRPDVVLMDLSMPELNGLDATAQITREFLGVRVLVLSMHGDEEYVAQALKAGACGYLQKDAGRAELEIAVRAAARGDRYLSPSVSRAVIEDYIQAAERRETPRDRLSPRQRQVLQLIAEGSSTKEIASKLSVSTKTVETHRAQLMKRLGVRDVAGVVRYAIRMGLVAVDD